MALFESFDQNDITKAQYFFARIGAKDIKLSKFKYIYIYMINIFMLSFYMIFLINNFHNKQIIIQIFEII